MFKLSTKQMTYSALLIVLSIIFSRFISINTPIFNIELGGVPIVAGGILFGPVVGGLIGFLSDLIGHLIRPFGAYHPGFALNETLTGVIPGLLFLIYKQGRKKLDDGIPNRSELPLITLILIGLAIGGSYYFYNVKKIGDIILDINANISLVILVNLSVLITLIVIYILRYRYPNKKTIYTIDRLILGLLLVEIMVFIPLTPLWLKLTFEVPYVSGVIVRVARVAFILPIKAIFLYVLLRSYDNKIKLI